MPKVSALALLICAVHFTLCTIASAQNIPRYDRKDFGGWADGDRDCQNTRHELLAELSTGPVKYSANGCRVVAGRWLDPYTNRIFKQSSDLDIDHLVPLHWAWQRGAWQWSRQKRRDFANDHRNLFAVDDGTNQSKGAKGPLQWLPPSTQFHCSYVTRFWRVVRMYELSIAEGERQEMVKQIKKVCGVRSKILQN